MQVTGDCLITCRVLTRLPISPSPTRCTDYSTACNITDAANEIAPKANLLMSTTWPRSRPTSTHTACRFGNWVINLILPEQTPTTRLDLEPRVLFHAGPA